MTTTSHCISALVLYNANFKILFVNAYMPRKCDVSSFDQYSFQLTLIHELISHYSECRIILGGDLNADFARSGRHTTLLRYLCYQADLVAVQHPCSKVDYTCNFGMKYFTVIHHFVLSEQLFWQTVCCVHVLHDIDNVTHHEPLNMELSIPVAQFTSMTSCIIVTQPEKK